MDKYYAKDLKKLRKKYLITNEELATKAGISVATIYRFQMGKDARYSTYKAIANVLKLELGQDNQGIYFYEPERRYDPARVEFLQQVSDKNDNYNINQDNQLLNFIKNIGIKDKEDAEIKLG